MNNPEPEIFTVLVQGEYGIEELRIIWNHKLQDVPVQQKHDIDANWQKLISSESFRQGKIFNGRLARLDGYSVNEQRLTLAISETDYKTLMYSNKNVERIISTWGESCLSRALGVSAVVLSSDQQIMLMKRNPFVGEFPNLYDVFGGHIEPESYSATGQPDIFAAISNELVQELNLSPADSHLICIGLIESTPNRKPELVFTASSSLESERIIQLSRKAKDSDEYVRIFSISNSYNSLSEFMKANKDRITPSAYGCLWLYLQMEE